MVWFGRCTASPEVWAGRRARSWSRAAFGRPSGAALASPQAPSASSVHEPQPPLVRSRLHVADKWPIRGRGHTRAMQDLAVGARMRSVRVRLGMQQAEVATRARVSDGTVSRIERGYLDTVSLRTLRAVASALEIRVDVVPRWRGGDLERAVSARHARLAEAAVLWLADIPGWAVRPEISFSIYGERGIIDLLAWHEGRRALLVIELKTEIVDVGETIGTLDRKARLAGTVAADLGWVAETSSVCLLVSDKRTNHRRLSEHAATFRAALPDDGRRLRAWLRTPIGRIQALTFLPDRHPGTARPTGSARCRVRRQRADGGRPR